LYVFFFSIWVIVESREFKSIGSRMVWGVLSSFVRALSMNLRALGLNFRALSLNLRAL